MCWSKEKKAPLLPCCSGIITLLLFFHSWPITPSFTTKRRQRGKVVSNLLWTKQKVKIKFTSARLWLLYAENERQILLADSLKSLSLSSTTARLLLMQTATQGNGSRHLGEWSLNSAFRENYGICFEICWWQWLNLRPLAFKQFKVEGTEASPDSSLCRSFRCQAI